MAGATQHIKDLFTMPLSWMKNVAKAMVPFALYFGAIGAAIGLFGAVFGGIGVAMIDGIGFGPYTDASTLAGQFSQYLGGTIWEHQAAYPAGIGAALGGGYGFLKGTSETLSQHAVRVTETHRDPVKDLSPYVGKAPARAHSQTVAKPVQRQEFDPNIPSNRIAASGADYQQKMQKNGPDLQLAR